MTKIGIVYGTTGGNTRLVCQKVATELEAAGHKVGMHRIVETSEHVFEEYDTFILGSPTYGHGQLDPHIIPFYDSLEGKVDLSGKKFAIVGLGDSKYDDDYNIESAVILREFALRHGGEIIYEPLLINKCPIPHLEERVQVWGKKLAEII